MRCCMTSFAILLTLIAFSPTQTMAKGPGGGGQGGGGQGGDHSGGVHASSGGQQGTDHQVKSAVASRPATTRLASVATLEPISGCARTRAAPGARQ